MVEVSVVARDKLGQPVHGLGREEFRLFDGGREEEIRSFHPPDAPVDTERVHPGAVVILFDNMNSRFENAGYARWALAQFFRDVEPRQPIALLSMDESFHILHAFSMDGASLAAALDAYHPKTSLFTAGSGPRPVIVGGRNLYGTVDALANRTYAGKRARITANATALLARFLAKVPGRKSLVWFSSVFPGYLAASVANEDVAIYPVDVTTPINGPGKAAQFLAERTGGAAFWNGNDLIGPLRQAYEDRAAAYMLGYYPSHDSWNRRFRPIRVVSGRPEVQLRHRAGYAAIPDSDTDPETRSR